MVFYRKSIILVPALIIASSIAWGLALESPTARAATCGPSTNFVTTWDTTKPGITNNQSIRITGASSGNNYSIDIGNDGTLDIVGVTTQFYDIDFGAPGVYTVGICGDFPQIDFSYAFDNQKILDVNQWGDNQWTDMSSAFYGAENMLVSAIDAPDLSNVLSTSWMFYHATTLTGNFSSWDISNLTNTAGMFKDAPNFNSDLSSWDTSSVTVMARMFEGATNFNGDISTWDTSSVTDMSRMFHDSLFNGDLSSWDTSNVTDMSFMFYGASNFTSDLSSWSTGQLSSANGMFFGALNFTSDLSSWSTVQLNSANGMFFGASNFTSDLSGWNTSGLTEMSAMFYGASNFTSDLANWNISLVTDMSMMLSSSGMSRSDYDATLLGWSIQSIQPGVSLGADGLKYCVSDLARQDMINNHGWDITGDSKECFLQVPVLPTLVKAFNPTFSTMNVSWGIPNDGGSPIIDYVIQYKKSSSISWLTFNDGVSTNNFTLVTGLDSDTDYDFRVVAVNIIGPSNFSQIATNRTLKPGGVAAPNTGLQNKFNPYILVILGIYIPVLVFRAIKRHANNH